jgi:porin
MILSLSPLLIAFLSAAADPCAQDSRPSTARDAAQTTPPPAAANPDRSPPLTQLSPDRFLSLSSSTLTGDWEGVRPSLRDRGINFNYYLNNQYQAVLNGGRDTEGGGRYAASVDAFVTLDLGKMGLMHDADVLLHLQSNWGAGINSRTGAIYEVNDDADGDLGLHVAQLWYRRHFLDRRLSLTFGFLDFQTIVDRNAYANSEDKQFWNQTLDNNPLVPLNIGLGVSLAFRPVDWYTITLGAGDGQSVLYKPGFSTTFHDEALFFGYLENAFAVPLPSKRGPLPGNYRIGLVYDPRVRAVFPTGKYDTRRDGDDYGLYVGFDQMIFREMPESEQGLGVFGRFGYRTPETNRVARFWSGGAAYQGLLPGRDNDLLGVGFSLARSGSLYRERVNDDFDNETVYELYYAIQISKWLVVTPDVQYVDNPGASSTLSHALVSGIRVRVSF